MAATAGAARWEGGVHQTISVPILKAWSLLRNFCEVTKYLPDTICVNISTFQQSQPGAVRRCTRILPLPSESKGQDDTASTVTVIAEERLLSMDEHNHTYSYCLDKSSLGMEAANYLSVVKLAPGLQAAESTTDVWWSWSMDPMSGYEEKTLGQLIDATLVDGIKGVEACANSH